LIDLNACDNLIKSLTDPEQNYRRKSAPVQFGLNWFRKRLVTGTVFAGGAKELIHQSVANTDTL
jgi:hypothetical protein